VVLREAVPYSLIPTNDQRGGPVPPACPIPAEELPRNRRDPPNSV
jgi:hypothetical protein